MSYLICGTGAIASALARRLPRIVVAGRSRDKLDGFTAAERIEVDFANTDSVRSTLAEKLPDDLAGVAYCVGSAVMKPLRGVSPGECVEAFQLNAVSALEMVQAALPKLKKNKGSVVLFSSVAVQTGFPNHVLIGASKGAVEGLTRSLAAELAPNVRVNAIAPSLTTGAAITSALTSNQKTAEKIAAAHPLPRLGLPDDSAAMAAFLLTEDSSWITGHVFPVDGGRGAIIR